MERRRRDIRRRARESRSTFFLRFSSLFFKSDECCRCHTRNPQLKWPILKVELSLLFAVFTSTHVDVAVLCCLKRMILLAMQLNCMVMHLFTLIISLEAMI